MENFSSKKEWDEVYKRSFMCKNYGLRRTYPITGEYTVTDEWYLAVDYSLNHIAGKYRHSWLQSIFTKLSYMMEEWLDILRSKGIVTGDPSNEESFLIDMNKLRQEAQTTHDIHKNLITELDALSIMWVKDVLLDENKQYNKILSSEKQITFMSQLKLLSCAQHRVSHSETRYVKPLTRWK